MDGLDALLELMDEGAAGDTVGLLADADEEEDLLLCLADGLATDQPGQQPQQQQQQLEATGSQQGSKDAHRQPQSTPATASSRPTQHGEVGILLTSPPTPAAAAAATVTVAVAAAGRGHLLQPRSSSHSGSSLKQQQQQQLHTAGAKQKQECLHFVEKLTGLKIKLPRVSGIVLKERYRQVDYVPVSKAKDHVAADGSSWVVIGVLVSKSFGTTSQGAPYSRWRISDLSGSDTWVGMFGAAHKEHYSEAEGSVLAFYQPRFSSKGPAGSSSSSSSSGLAVSQADQVELLATSAGWAFCRGKTKTGARCQNAVDTTVSQFCQYHALQQAKTLKAGICGAAAGRTAAPAPAAALAAKTAAAQMRPGFVAPVAPAAAPASGNGKVYDARKRTWSTVSININSSSGNTAVNPYPGSSASSSGMKGSSGIGSQGSGNSGTGGGRSGGTSSSEGSSLGGPIGDAAAAAAAARVAANCAAEQQRRRTAHQAEITETLRRKLLQQKLHGKQKQQQQQHTQSTAGARARSAGNSQPAGGGFCLSAVVSAVDAHAGIQEQQQQQQHQQQQQLVTSAAGCRAASLPRDSSAAGSADNNSRIELEEDGLDALFDQLFEDGECEDAAAAVAPQQQQQQQQHMAAAGRSRAGDAPTATSILKARHKGSGGATPAAAAAAGGAATAAAAAAGAVAAGGHGSAGCHTGTASRPAVPSTQQKQQNKQQKLRAGLGLGSKGPAAAAAAAAGAQGKSGTSRMGGSSATHVSRIGAAPSAAAAVAAAQGAGKHGVTGSSTTATGNSGGSSFKNAFSRVLQRQDINKPDARLLSAAADEQHAAAFSKLLDQYEQKDKLAQQLEGITKLQVTAFECRTCKALTEKRRASCSGHDIVAVRVMKRWWLCDACGWRVTTLREVMPSKRCPKCRDPGVQFTATSAYNAPKPAVLLSSTHAAAGGALLACREAMLPRGEEQPKFLNSFH